MSEIIFSFVILLGSFVIFTGAYGFYKFPDPWQRFHPPTKISLLGLGLIVLGESLDFGIKTGDWEVRSLLVLPFLILLSPLAAHLLAKSLLSKTSDRHS